MALQEKSFENVDGWTADACLYYKLTYEHSAQVSKQVVKGLGSGVLES